MRDFSMLTPLSSTRRSLCAWAAIVVGSTASAQCLEWTNQVDLPGVPPMAGSTLAEIAALEVFDDGSGPALYAGGRFHEVGGVSAYCLAKWDGAAWTAVVTGAPFQGSIGDRVTALLADGPSLYVGGTFDRAAYPPKGFVSRIGSAPGLLGTWSSGDDDHPATIPALAMFDGGTGPALHVGGRFFGSVQRLAGTTWVNLGGSGLELAPGWLEAATVHALQVFDDGTGRALYAGGDFNYANGAPLKKIGRWNGSTWSSIGVPAGMSEVVPAACRALTVFDDGSGTGLFAACDKYPAGPNGESTLVARWRGHTWTEIGTAFGAPGAGAAILALRVFDDGTGAALYAAGSFASIGGRTAANIAKWDGSSWSALGAGIGSVSMFGGPVVYALEGFDDGSGHGAALYSGGRFNRAGGDAVKSLAAWKSCTFAGTPFCFGDGSLATPCPCVPPNVVPSPSGAPDAGCANSFHASGAKLSASGTTNPDAVRLHTSAQTPVGYSMLVVGNASIPAGFAVADGVRCAGGSMLRFGAQNATAGTIVYPNVALGLTVPLSFVSGVTPGLGQTRGYQGLYRDAAPGFCGPGTYNFTNAVELTW